MNRLMVYLLAVCLTVGNARATTPDEWIEEFSGMRFVRVAKGCFNMGAARGLPPPGEIFWERVGMTPNLAEDETPRHEVCLDEFWIGKFEVTRGEWAAIMGREADAETERAVASVTWHEAREVARQLTHKSAGRHVFRLPTESEWEAACRRGEGKELEAPDRDALARRAWFERRDLEPQTVGRLQANTLGMHDLLGNVWEWTLDAYDARAYSKHALFNPRVDTANGPRVIRGGSFRTEVYQVRCGTRGRYDPEARLRTVGFRLVREN